MGSCRLSGNQRPVKAVRSWLKECENFSPPCRKFRLDCWAIRVKHLVWTSHGWWTFQMSDCQPGNHALQRSVLECGRLQINWTGSSCFSVQVWRWMVMKNYKWVVNFSCSKLLKEWWWRPTSEFVNFSCSELLIYPYLAWNDVFIPIYVLNELLQANIRIRTITRICGDRWSIFAQVILTLLILSCAAQYVLCSHCCYNCHQTSWMDLASFGPYAMHFWKIYVFQVRKRNCGEIFLLALRLKWIVTEKTIFRKIVFFQTLLLSVMN